MVLRSFGAHQGCVMWPVGGEDVVLGGLSYYVAIVFVCLLFVIWVQHRQVRLSAS